MSKLTIAKAYSQEDVTIEVVKSSQDKNSRERDGIKLAQLLWESLPSKTYTAMQDEFTRLQVELNKQFPESVQ